MRAAECAGTLPNLDALGSLKVLGFGPSSLYHLTDTSSEFHHNTPGFSGKAPVCNRYQRSAGTLPPLTALSQLSVLLVLTISVLVTLVLW